MSRYKAGFLRLVNVLTPISKEYGKSKIWFLWDALKGYIRYGITPNEYIGFEWYKRSSLEKRRYFTNRDQNKYEEKFNDSSTADSFNRKNVTNRVFSKYVKRDWIYGGDSTLQDIQKFVTSHDKIIIKPINLSSGRGIFTISKSGGDTFETILDKLGVSLNDAKNAFSNLLIEEFVTQHPLIAECNESSVNTIRIYTVSDRSQNLIFLSGCMRVGGNKADVDNYHAGGVAYPLDMLSGIVCGAGRNIKGEKFLVHPSSGKMMIGFMVPNWERLKKVVRDLAKIEPKGRMIAWDLAITETGFELIEANYRPGVIIMQQGINRGLKPEILSHL